MDTKFNRSGAAALACKCETLCLNTSNNPNRVDFSLSATHPLQSLMFWTMRLSYAG